MEGKPLSEGTTAQFRWTESATELAVSFPLGEDQGARSVQCDFRPRVLRVQVGGGEVVEGELRGKVTPDDCYWIIDDESGARELKVVLTKTILYDRWDGVFRKASKG